MENGYRVLIVDDEIEIVELVQDYLEREGFGVLTAGDGQAALAAARREKPDLIVLDIMLPKVDGFEVCRQLRSETVAPIIMLSAKGQEVDKILGLGLGADDYITKPFSPGELVARVKAHLRRSTLLSKGQDENIITCGELTIDINGYKVIRRGQEVALPTREFELLRFLALHPNQVFTREQLFEKVWGYNYVGDDSTVTVHIRRIREKLEDDPKNPGYLKTVWGVGYKFEGES
jgi:DNA-binding response OmpR family regulator